MRKSHLNINIFKKGQKVRIARCTCDKYSSAGIGCLCAAVGRKGEVVGDSRYHEMTEIVTNKTVTWHVHLVDLEYIPDKMSFEF